MLLIQTLSSTLSLRKISAQLWNREDPPVFSISYLALPGCVSLLGWSLWYLQLRAFCEVVGSYIFYWMWLGCVCFIICIGNVINWFSSCLMATLHHPPTIQGLARAKWRQTVDCANHQRKKDPDLWNTSLWKNESIADKIKYLNVERVLLSTWHLDVFLMETFSFLHFRKNQNNLF